MIDDSKHIRSDVDGVRGVRGKSEEKTVQRNAGIWSAGSEFLIPLISGSFQISVGLSIVAVSILGLITPLWLAAILSVAGSVSTMSGVFLVYHSFTSKGTFDSLINQAIKRVINSQN